ncbi:MAG: sigma-54 dependent transcriptional regulator [Syntrophales bacterium]|nr:sigma-54 dependent transcriptional regulator [Syntrophales bacterium]MDY0043094.1 sigma-54 dependent transcriptional regulator [Syntrophales bacterium]
MSISKILIVDDEPSMRAALSESLSLCGYEVETAGDGQDALEKFRSRSYEVVITDMRMPGLNGLEVLRGIKKLSPATPVIVITAYGTVNTAVEAMRAGAFDFIMKPFSLEHLETAVKKVASCSSQVLHSTYADSEDDPPEEKVIITRDGRMQTILSMMRTIADSRSSVLIQGKSGTGKELLARYIHRTGKRADMPFIAVNCAAIPGNLLESEMFGYEKGAFTGASQKKPGKFEIADGGTLLLDEISEMDLQLQAKLLRVIQESEVDRLGGNRPISVNVRIIATTNTDIKKSIAERKFREDLFYRINVIPVTIPSLKERMKDIPLLADFFLDKYSRLNGIHKPRFSGETIEMLMRYEWPGNVRELENVIERSVLISGGETILPEHLYLECTLGGKEKAKSCISPVADEKENISCEAEDAGTVTLHEMERGLIFETLRKAKGNKTKASMMLGISVRTMRNKLNEYRNEKLPVDES